MTTIKPFCAIRPRKDIADQVAALPYDVYSREEAREFVSDKPLSFLNIDRPETQFDKDHDIYAEDVYDKASELLQEEIQQGIFVKEEKPCFYLYELTMNGRSQTGIVALSSVDDYLNGVCRKHEDTVAAKEVDRIHHVDTCNAQTGPIFLTYKENEVLSNIVSCEKQKECLYDFVSEDGIGHRVWKVESSLSEIEEAFKGIENTYIADGHHRAASAMKVALKRREKYPDYTGEEEFNYFLSVLFPDSELKIYDYNRYVKDLNGKSKEEFLACISNVCDIQLVEKGYPEKKHQYRMYLCHQWYQLDVKEEVIEKHTSDPVDQMDVSILQQEILYPILNIQDPRSDSRIEFIGGIRGLEELEEKVNQASCDSVSFAVYPTDIQELLDVADAKLKMPPKSTWFEPKLRSGLFIHEFEQ